MATAHGKLVLTSYSFIVTIQDFPFEMGFSNVSGLSDESEVIEYREGKDPLHMARVAGMRSLGSVTLERGITPGRPRGEHLQKSLNAGVFFDLSMWRQGVAEVESGTNAFLMMDSVVMSPNTLRKHVIIDALGDGQRTSPSVNSSFTEERAAYGGRVSAATWKLYNCWPTSLEIGDLDASSSDILIESMTLSVTDMKRIN